MCLKTRMLNPGLELNPCQQLTQNVVLQTKYFVQHDEMENECSLAELQQIVNMDRIMNTEYIRF